MTATRPIASALLMLAGLLCAAAPAGADSLLWRPDETPVTSEPPNWDYSFAGPLYEDVMAEVYQPELRGRYAGPAKASCRPNPRATIPCPGTLRAYAAFIERHSLEESYASASLYEAYTNGQYRIGDRLFARLKGYTLPRYYGPGEEVIAMNLPIRAANRGCSHNYFAASPCPRSVRLWKLFAKRHGLALDYRSARIFEAYAMGSFRAGDLLYAEAKDLPAPLYAGPGKDVVALGLKRRAGKGGLDCRFNIFASATCPGTLRAWEAFARDHGLKLDRHSATIFEAYSDYDFQIGDVLLAETKGISVRELRRHGEAKGEAPEESGPKASGNLTIEIHPSPVF